jgi:predicted transposase YbfD/YdcC
MSTRRVSLSESVFLYFSGIKDPRVEGRCQHLFLEMIFITVCAVLCGAESFTEIKAFGEQKKDWLKKFLELSNGIPSEDTFRRLFSALEPKIFSLALTEWVRATLSYQKIARVSFDGKTVAGTDRRVNTRGSNRLHLLNVFDHTNGLALAQMPCRSTATTETDAILECLEFLDIEESLVSVDAGSSNQRATGKIREKNADYLCPIKKNQRHALREIDKTFSSLMSKKANRLKSAITKAKSHGRYETRRATIMDANEMSLAFREFWKDVRCVIRISRIRETNDTRPLIQEKSASGKVLYRKNENKRRQTEETIYYICSRKISAKEALQEIRAHWGIENKLHWSLDVAFAEDQWRVRDKNAAANLSTVRKYAFNLIKQCKSKGSQRVKMKQAAWNNDYLEKLIGEVQF